ncbi:DNA-binding response regulator [Malaciobacter mytili LMG 24559]|uniref:DNA-binding response regulator n=2 Tax=Malaciobacter mytili TaxID=603050 RepID=A0AAX2AHZ3_9BACT|nr:DNA-binding response regulator [Malaciobacter mytili LMG 24559]
MNSMSSLLDVIQNEIEVLIVEDEIVLALALEVSLNEMGFSVSSIESNAIDTLSFLNKKHPDIILMDINLNDSIDGIQLAKQVWDRYKIPIVFLTSYCNDRVIKKAMQCEPYGYLIKPCKDKEVKATLLAALHKHRYFFQTKKHQEISEFIFLEENLKFDTINKRLYKNNKQIKLTKNEIKLFEIMSQKAGEVVSFDTISSYIYRQTLFDMGKLRTLVYRLKQKLQTNPFENIYDMGYKLKVLK